MAKYTLPIASNKDLGGIKVGDDFEIDQEGRLNVKDMDELRQTAENLSQQVSAGKALIASAITDKHVATSADDTFQIMAKNIQKINTGVSYASVNLDINVLPYQLIEGGV